MSAIVARLAGFGSEFNRMVREAEDPAPFFMAGFGEMLASPDNRVTVDKDKKDAWGLPVARIECAHGENERAMAKDMAESMKEMAASAGVQTLFVNPVPSAPGYGIHEVGAARMGSDPKKSVL